MPNALPIILVCTAFLLFEVVFYFVIKKVIRTVRQKPPEEAAAEPVPDKLPEKDQTTVAPEQTSEVEAVQAEQPPQETKPLTQEEMYLSQLRSYSIGLKGITKAYWSEKVLICAIESNIADIKLIPLEKKTFNLCAVATLLEIKAQHIPQDFGIQFTDPNTIDYGLCKKIVDKSPKLLQIIPEQYQTEELKDLALKGAYWALSYLPESERTYERCMKALESSPLAIRYIPSQFLSDELCREAITRDPTAFKSIPDKFITRDLAQFAVTMEGKLLENVDSGLVDENLCMAAVKSNCAAIKFVPEKYRTSELLQAFSASVEKHSYTDAAGALKIFNDNIPESDSEAAAKGFSRQLKGLERRDLKYIKKIQADAIEFDLHSLTKDAAQEYVLSLLSHVNTDAVRQLIFVHGFSHGTGLADLLMNDIEHPRIEEVEEDLENEGVTIYQIA